MIRAVCIISREYPPDTAFGGIARLAHMQAAALAQAGLSVHVLTLDPTGVGRTVLENGVVVHRIAPSPVPVPPELPYVGAGMWSMTLADAYRRIDADVGFDIVQAQDYYAEPLHLELRPETPLVTYLNAPSLVVSEQFGRVRTPGELGLELLEGAALRRADLLLAPTELVLSETRRLHGDGLPPATLCPHQVDLTRFSPESSNQGFAPSKPGPEAPSNRLLQGPGTSASPLRALFLGRLEPLKGPALALRAVAAARRAGIDVRLTLVGRDVPQPNLGSYRRNVLFPLLDELGLDHDAVRFVEQVDEAGVVQHLRHADVALLPSVFENFHTAAVEALAAGVPVICGARSGLRTWVADGDGLRAVPTDDPDAFATAAAAALADAEWLTHARTAGPARVRDAFDPRTVTARQLEIYESLVAARRHPTATRARPPGPRLGVVVLAHNQLAYTQRCVRSLLEHTDVPLRIVVVDNASTDGTAEWVASLGEPVELIRLEENRGVSGGRNAGITALEGSVDYVAFLDNDTEVVADWSAPFLDVLASNPDIGIAGERGHLVTITEEGRVIGSLDGAGPLACDMVVGFCMVMHGEALSQIGRFDEALGLFWHDDDDICLRAARLGWGVCHVGSGRIHHFGHRSSELVDGIWDGPEQPAALSEQNQRYLAGKWHSLGTAGVAGTGSVVVLALAEQLVEQPSLASAYATTFGADDDVTLVVLAHGWSNERIATALEPALAEAGLTEDTAPDVLVLAPPLDESLDLVARTIDAALGSRPDGGPFHSAPWFGAGRLTALRALVGRRLSVVAALRGPT